MDVSNRLSTLNWKSPWTRTSAMPVNGNNDKQLRYKLINVVGLVFLIPPSFTFDNQQRTAAVTSFHFQSEMCVAACTVIIALCLCRWNIIRLAMCLLFFFFTLIWSMPTLIGFHRVHYIPLFYDSEHRAKCAPTKCLQFVPKQSIKAGQKVNSDRYCVQACVVSQTHFLKWGSLSCVCLCCS